MIREFVIRWIIGWNVWGIPLFLYALWPLTWLFGVAGFIADKWDARKRRLRGPAVWSDEHCCLVLEETGEPL